MKCILGGTFNILHKGHRKLLEAALAFDELEIGLTSDRFAREIKSYPSVPYGKRKSNLTAFLESVLKKSKIEFSIKQIDDKYGFAHKSDADAIIVSQETEAAAQEINALRLRLRRKPLKIISVPISYAEDYLKISSQRIHEKKINAEGKRLKPVLFALGTVNPSKKEGVENAAKKLFKKFKVQALKVKSGISEQPFDEETVEGAMNRAKAAYYTTGADFGIGIESGIFKLGEFLHDIAICAIFDGERTTLGNSMGFQMPPQTLQLLSQHKDLGAVMEGLSGIEKIGYKKGAIHYLSAGLLDRQMMNEQAFLCAMIPRISEAKGVFRYF